MAAVDVIWFHLVLLALPTYLEGACLFGSSSSCIFPCNCANDTQCDDQTGACPGGCRDGQPRPVGEETKFNWRGPGCRIGNVALKKVINQSGVLGQWYANHSVDGKLPSTATDEPATCAHTAVHGTNFAWWRVDLEGVYHIDNITIFNRFNSAQRTAQLNIRVGNSSDISENPLCLYYHGPVPAGGSDTLTCSSPIVGRFVSLQRIGGLDTNIINICEVVVMGYEAIGVDCSRCDSDCSTIVGCKECVGFTPPLCIISCDAGRYGINCASSCFDYGCKGGYTTCGHVTGECPDGCQDWYIGGKCDTHISEEGFNPQSQVSAAAINTTSIEVTWRPDEDITPSLAQYYGYQVQYKASNDSEFLSGPNVSHVHGETKYRAVISGLIFNTWYTLRVSLYRHNGDLYEISPWPTREVMVKTPCVAPNPVTMWSLTYSDCTGPITLHVVWERLFYQSTSSGCNNVASILVLYKLHTTDEWMTHDVMNPTSSISVNITDATDGVWEVKVRVMNNEDISSDSETRSITIQALGTTITAPSDETKADAMGCFDACSHLVTPFAALFGVSAIVNLVFIMHCLWMKIRQKQTNPLTVTSPTTVDEPRNYEGLVGPTSIVPESPYDELCMEENQASKEPEYEQM